MTTNRTGRGPARRFSVLTVVATLVPTVALTQVPWGAGAELRVNTFTTGLQAAVSVAAFQDGGFVAAWNSDGSFGTDRSAESIQARIFGPIDPTRVFTDRFETGDTSRWSSSDPAASGRR